jgi:DNA-binding transcriptional MocR family regulator
MTDNVPEVSSPALAEPVVGRTGLSRDAGVTLTEQIASLFAERIRQRLLAPGARLPSVRECARRHGVSPHTVVAAYDQLLAQGLVEARRQRGFFVRERPVVQVVPTAVPTIAVGPALPPVDATALIRGLFYNATGQSAPGLGTLPPEWLDMRLLSSALRRVLGQGHAGPGLQYGHPAGDVRLREALAQRLADIGLQVSPGQIVTATGATHALDIIARTLLAPGDPVLVDEPGWAVEYARLSQLGARLLRVPRGAEGPDLEVLAALARENKPRMYVTMSVLHNPTGQSLSPACAHQILRLAEVHDFRIVEDDTYAHFAAPHLPRLSALDGLRRTLYVSSFSKILAPNWRVGFLAAPPGLVEPLQDHKLLSSLTTPALLEQAVAHCLEQGSLRRHAERVMSRLDAARQRTVSLALAHGCRFVTPPAGLFGWVDTGVDTAQLSHTMHDQGWLLAPGHIFLAQQRPTTLMRINFAASQDARFWRDFALARRAARA